MTHVPMKAPANSGGFTIGNQVYKPDAEGQVEVHVDHVEHARSHGFKPLSFVPDAQTAPTNDPNVQRPTGAAQHHVQPGNAPVPQVSLTKDEEEHVLADETAKAGRLLNDSEKQSILAGALAAKKKYVFEQMGLKDPTDDTATGETGETNATAGRTKKA